MCKQKQKRTKTKRKGYLVVNAKGLIRMLHQLMHRKGSIVRLNNRIRDLGGWNHGESGHHTVGEFFADLGDQQGPHTSTSSAAQGVSNLETLKAVAVLSFATDHIDHLVYQLGTLRIMTLGPVVTSARLAEYKVVGTKEFAKRAGTHGIHGAGFKVDEHGTRHILLLIGL